MLRSDTQHDSLPRSFPALYCPLLCQSHIHPNLSERRCHWVSRCSKLLEERWQAARVGAECVLSTTQHPVTLDPRAASALGSPWSSWPRRVSEAVLALDSSPAFDPAQFAPVTVVYFSLSGGAAEAYDIITP